MDRCQVGRSAQLAPLPLGQLTRHRRSGIGHPEALVKHWRGGSGRVRTLVDAPARRAFSSLRAGSP